MGLSLDEVAHQAITRFALRMASHGVIPNRMVPLGETNKHRMVDAGKAPNFLDAIDVLARDCLQLKLQVMAELETYVGIGKMGKVVTDRDHGYSLRVILSENGIVFDVAFKGEADTVH